MGGMRCAFVVWVWDGLAAWSSCGVFVVGARCFFSVISMPLMHDADLKLVQFLLRAWHWHNCVQHLPFEHLKNLPGVRGSSVNVSELVSVVGHLYGLSHKGAIGLCAGARRVVVSLQRERYLKIISNIHDCTPVVGKPAD